MLLDSLRITKTPTARLSQGCLFIDVSQPIKDKVMVFEAREMKFEQKIICVWKQIYCDKCMHIHVITG